MTSVTPTTAAAGRRRPFARTGFPFWVSSGAASPSRRRRYSKNRMLHCAMVMEQSSRNWKNGTSTSRLARDSATMAVVFWSPMPRMTAYSGASTHRARLPERRTAERFQRSRSSAVRKIRCRTNPTLSRTACHRLRRSRTNRGSTSAQERNNRTSSTTIARYSA